MNLDSTLNADLHCHSVVSDGTLTPEALAERAKHERFRELVRGLGVDTCVVVSTHLVEGLHAPALKGSYTLQQALRLILQGSGLAAQRVGDGYVIKRSDRSDAVQLDAGT